MFTSVLNGIMDHSMELLANRDVHNYNTRNKDMLKLPLAAKIGISRECVITLKD